jgi:type II secretory ATPase GspE/PulE/Tfp pilus assembly ATPase PilB-like protein
MSETIKKLITARPTANEIRAKAQEDGVRSLREDGLEKAARGITTIEEVLRVTEMV